MRASGRTIAIRALKKLGVIGQGQTIKPNDLVDVFDILNNMVDAWAADSMLIYVLERQEYPLTNGVGTYTLGEGGTFNHVRPMFLDKISIISNNNPTRPLELPLDVLDALQWQSVPVKSTPSALPTRVYREYSFPFMNLTYWPIPNVGTLKTALYLPTPLSQFADFDTLYDFPPAYKRALEYGLAVDASSDFSVEPPPLVVTLAERYIGDVRVSNIRPEIVPCDPAVVRGGTGWNYYTGEVK